VEPERKGGWSRGVKLDFLPTRIVRVGLCWVDPLWEGVRNNGSLGGPGLVWGGQNDSPEAGENGGELRCRTGLQGVKSETRGDRRRL